MGKFDRPRVFSPHPLALYTTQEFIKKHFFFASAGWNITDLDTVYDYVENEMSNGSVGFPLKYSTRMKKKHDFLPYLHEYMVKFLPGSPGWKQELLKFTAYAEAIQKSETITREKLLRGSTRIIFSVDVVFICLQLIAFLKAVKKLEGKPHSNFNPLLKFSSYYGGLLFLWHRMKKFKHQASSDYREYESTQTEGLRRELFFEPLMEYFAGNEDEEFFVRTVYDLGLRINVICSDGVVVQLDGQKCSGEWMTSKENSILTAASVVYTFVRIHGYIDRQSLIVYSTGDDAAFAYNDDENYDSETMQLVLRQDLGLDCKEVDIDVGFDFMGFTVKDGKLQYRSSEALLANLIYPEKRMHRLERIAGIAYLSSQLEFEGKDMYTLLADLWDRVGGNRQVLFPFPSRKETLNLLNHYE